MNPVTKDLRKVRELLSDPNKWLKGRLANNDKGVGVDPNSPDATCFCLLGATYKVTGFYGYPTCNAAASNQYARVVDRLCDAVRKHHPSYGTSAMGFNDSQGTSHADVLNLIDKAIELSQLEPA